VGKQTWMVGALLSAVLVMGCSAAGVFYSSDPATQLSNAAGLFDIQGRPLPAEQLIVDAIDTYRKSDDQAGLAEAYRVYGLFFRCRALAQPAYAAHYREKGFLDKSATYDTRYEVSLHYFGMAESIYKAKGQYDKLSNVYFHMGDVRILQGNSSAACHYYDESLSAHAKFLEENPGSTVDPGSKKSFEQTLAGAKKYAGCS
jgi:hypothetical protein